jgi:hypothetical protein
MCGNSYVGHTKKALGHNGSHFEAIKVLVLYLACDSFQGSLDLGRSNGAEERRLDFVSHEKEFPSRSLDLVVESKNIKRLHHPPVSEVWLALESQNLGHAGRLFADQNRSDLNDWRHGNLCHCVSGVEGKPAGNLAIAATLDAPRLKF